MAGVASAITISAFVRFEGTVGAELAFADAEAVQAGKDAFGLRLARQDAAREVDFESVFPGGELGGAELNPGNLGPVAQAHQVGGEVVGLVVAPGAAVDAPAEGGADKFVADACPDLVTAGAANLEGITEAQPRGGQLLGGGAIDAAKEPVATGKGALGTPAGDLEAVRPRGHRFALDPDVIRRRQGSGGKGSREQGGENDFTETIRGVHAVLLPNLAGRREAQVGCSGR